MIDNSVPVKAYDFETRELIGEYASVAKATRALFIRSHKNITNYLAPLKTQAVKRRLELGDRTEGKKRGVSNYKNGTKYHFEYAKQ